MLKRTILLACFFICADCMAQQYPFVHYTPKDGLVNSRVHRSWQDSKGRMFFLTFGGLSIYDGTRFKNYTQENGLATDLINDVMEMGDDSTWIACNTNALNYLRQGRIHLYRTSDGFCPTINRFIRTTDGAIYVAADEGLFLFDKNRFTRYPVIDKNGHDAGRFLIDAIDCNGMLLVVADQGMNGGVSSNLFLFDRKSQRIVAENENRFIATYCRGDQNQVYIIDEKGKLQLLDTIALKQHQIKYLPPPAAYRNVMSGVHHLYFDEKKNFWFYAYNEKLVKLDQYGRRKEFSMANGLSSNRLSGIFVDREGSAWFSMDGPGVDKLANDNIELYEKFNGMAINLLYTDEFTESAYLYSTQGKSVLTAKGNQAKTYDIGNIRGTTMTVAGDNIYLADAKNIFIVPQDSRKTYLNYRDTAEAAFGNIFPDPYKNIVLCGSSYLTVLVDGSPVCHYPINYYIDQIAFDSKKRLWGASRAGELFLLNTDPAKPKQYLSLLKKFDTTYPRLSARAITVDRFDNVWIGTRYSGLYCFQFNKDFSIRSFRQYGIKEGLSDNFITHLTCDQANNIWVSTAAGLDKIVLKGKDLRIENVTRSSNLYEHILKSFVDKNGTAWSYTADGNLILIDKSSDSASFTPTLMFTEFKVGDSMLPVIPHPGNYSYRQNNFSFSVAATSFYDEQQIRYTYLLDGSGTDQWSDSSNNSTFRFVNLHPGNYTLKVKAIFPGKRYPDQTIEYSFLIHPPWWQRWWFKLTAALFGIGIIVFVIRSYYNRKLARQQILSERQQAVEKERTRIATDIHDDLGSGLSRIRYLGEMVKLKSLQQKDILPDVEKISVFSDEMVDKMNEIVWALNEKNDSLKAIIAYSRSFAAEYLSNNNIRCLVNLPDEIPDRIIKGETRRNIFLSVKECLHNIVKHAGATEAIITIRVSDQLVIDIHDNGKGIDWDKIRPFSNGLMNIKKRMKDAGGTADFSNESGTKVHLSIPLL